MSPVITGAQFRTSVENSSNLDRCNRCGAPRSAHDIDRTCPSSISHGRKWFALFVGLVGLLTLAGIALLTVSSNTSMTIGTLGASGFLAGLTLLVCGLVLAGRRL
jgi:hypothetical protein